MGKINIYDKMKIRQNNKWKISPWLRRHPSYLKKCKASERTTERPNILVMPHQPTNEKAFDSNIQQTGYTINLSMFTAHSIGK